MTVDLGGAKEAKMKHGGFQGRSESDLANALKQVMMQKSTSVSGTVGTLCISPVNGQRIPCDAVEAKQSILGDCQCKEGYQSPAAAKIKNDGALLGDENENAFIESLLAAVSIGDQDMVREVVSGVTPPRSENIWVTGDNVYLSGVDMSWNNFHIGDLLVFPGAVVVNTGYPHFACWKYAVRAGDAPKSYINSAEGTRLRTRGIKGSFLLPSSARTTAAIKNNDPARIVHKGTPEYKDIVKDCRTPLAEGSELVFRMITKEFEGAVLRAAANDTQAYIDLLVAAGSESGRIDLGRYNRTLPDETLQELGVATKGDSKQSTSTVMEISAAAKSGDGSVENIGVKMNGAFQCPDCRQRFDSEQAKQIHWKFIHDPNRLQED